MNVDFHVKNACLLFVPDLNQHWNVYRNFTKNLQYVHEKTSGSSSVIPWARTWPRWQSLTLALHDYTVGGIWGVHFGIGASSVCWHTKTRIESSRSESTVAHSDATRHLSGQFYAKQTVCCRSISVSWSELNATVLFSTNTYVGSLGLDHFIKVKVKQSRYRPGVAQRVPGR
jgi:hypothetical protein